MSAFDLINLIVNVAGRVANSAQIARCNKQQCAELAEQAKLVASIVQSMRERANALSPEAIQTLRSINDALESVLTLVASCERSNWLNKYWKASEFDKALDNSKHRLVIALGAIQPIVLGVAVDQKEQIASLKRLLEAKSERRWARDNAIRGDIERLAHHLISNDRKFADMLERLERLAVAPPADGAGPSAAASPAAGVADEREVARMAAEVRSARSALRLDGDKQVKELVQQLVDAHGPGVESSAALAKELEKAAEELTSERRYRDAAVLSAAAAATLSCSDEENYDPIAPPMPPSMLSMDVCFMLDATGSMGEYIEEMKNKVVAMTRIMQEANPGLTMRLACIAYRDWTKDRKEPSGAPRLEKLPFTTDPTRLRDFLSGLEATGGADGPEDVAGALSEVNRIDGGGWTSPFKALIHISDAPGHGRAVVPDDMEDYYPDKDPAGLGDYKQLLRELSRLKIAYFFYHVNRSATEKMVAHFNSFFAKYQVTEVGLDKPIDLQDMLIQSLTATMQRGSGAF